MVTNGGSEAVDPASDKMVQRIDAAEYFCNANANGLSESSSRLFSEIFHAAVVAWPRDGG